MVNNTIVSRFRGPLPLGRDDDRKIQGGPLYDRHEILDLIKRHQAKIIPWSVGCINEARIQNLGDEECVSLVSIAMNHGRYLSSEWCKAKENGPWAACDAYSMLCREESQITGIKVNVKYYIKLAISITGTVLLLASCHPSREDR